MTRFLTTFVVAVGLCQLQLPAADPPAPTKPIRIVLVGDSTVSSPASMRIDLISGNSFGCLHPRS